MTTKEHIEAIRNYLRMLENMEKSGPLSMADGIAANALTKSSNIIEMQSAALRGCCVAAKEIIDHPGSGLYVKYLAEGIIASAKECGE